MFAGVSKSRPVQNQVFTEREFSGIFSLAGVFCVVENGIFGGPDILLNL